MKVNLGGAGSAAHILKRALPHCPHPSRAARLGTPGRATAPRVGARRADFINQFEVLEFFAQAERAYAYFGFVVTDVIDYSDRAERKQTHPIANSQIALRPAHILPGRARDALWNPFCFVGLSRQITDDLAIANYAHAAQREQATF